VLTNPSEKRGGSFNESAGVVEFREFLMNNGLMDKGFIGPQFTWVRSEKGRSKTWERPDRGVCSPEWKAM